MTDDSQSQGERQTLLPSHNRHVQDSSSKKKEWRYYLIWLWRIVIFGITGSLSVHVTRLLLNFLHVTAKNKWFYYTAFFFAELMVYTLMIMTIGTLLFQWRFFCLVAFKMWSWALPYTIRTWCFEHLHSHRITL